MSFSQTTEVGSVIARGGEAARAMSQESPPSVFDVWTHSYDGMAERMKSAAQNPSSILDASPAQQGNMLSAATNTQASSVSQVADSISAQARGFGQSIDAIGEADGALETVGATFAMLTGVEQMLSSVLSVIPFPALPALRIADFDIGLPHAHAHPPNLIPPAPPVPLPSMGPVIPIPLLSGSLNTLINGMPAARCGDMGLGIWCGGYFPMYEVFLGSSSVWIEGMRAARMLVDITKHCLFTVPKPNDPPLGPMIGTTISASPNVLIGGVPMPSLLAIAMGQLMKGAFRLAGKGARAFNRVTAPLRRRVADALGLDSGFLRCNVLRAEPVNAITGEVFLRQEDFTLKGILALQWTRTYGSHSSRRGVCGYGWSTPADARLVIEEDGAVLFHDGLSVARIFPHLPEQGAVMELVDGAILESSDRSLRVRVKGGLSYLFKQPSQPAKQLPVDQIEDPSGNSFRYVRDEHGLKEIIEGAGRRIEVRSDGGLVQEMRLRASENELPHVLVRYEYSEAGELLATFDAMEQPCRYEYAHRRLVRHTNRNQVSFCYDYDGEAQSARCHHAWGDDGLFDYHFEFDPSVRRIKVTDSKAGHATIQLGDLNLPVWEIDALGGITRFEYDDRGRTTAVVDPDGHRIGYEYDDRGNLVKLTQPDGACMQMDFNARSRPVAITTPSGARWEQKWDERELLLEQISPLGAITRYEYDARSLLVAFTNAGGGRTDLSFDRFGNLMRIRDALGNHTRFSYDARGNVTGRLDALERATRYRYDANNRLTEAVLPSGGSLRYAYDGEGNVVSFTDRHGAQTRLEYSGQGVTTKRIQPDGHVLQYHYDTEEQLIGVTNQRGEHYQLRRDALGRVIEEVDYWGQSTTYRYTGGGHLKESRDSLGRIVHYKTDPLGRITSKRLPHRHIPGRTVEETFKFDADGRLIACQNEHAKIERQLDADGRVLEERQNDFVLRNTYDVMGRRVRRESSNGHKVAFEYDTLSRLAAVRINDEAPMRFEHDAAGQLLKETLGPSLERHKRYDEEGRLTSQSFIRGYQSLFRTEYDYDLEGDLTQRRDSQYGTDLFRYDPLHQIVEHIDPFGHLERFTQDPAGDRLTVRAVGEVGRSGVYLGASYDFDRAGNLAERRDAAGTTRFTWSANRRLLSSSSEGVETSYTYDPLGRRVCKQTGATGTRFGWDDYQLIVETHFDHSRVSANEYVYYAHSYVPLALIEHSGDSYRYHTDPNGSPMRLTARDGNTVWAARYEASGRAVPLVEKVDSPLRLQGQYFDRETGLHYNTFRYFDPHAGRFVSLDPIGMLSGNENLYAFAPNPLGYIDPLGWQESRFPTWMDTRSMYQRQHIVPYSLRNHDFFLRTGMDINGASNMMYMPMWTGVDPNPLLGLHRGWTAEHAAYNAAMELELDALEILAEQHNWDYRRCQQELIALQHERRRGTRTGVYTCAS